MRGVSSSDENSLTNDGNETTTDDECEDITEEGQDQEDNNVWAEDEVRDFLLRITKASQNKPFQKEVKGLDWGGVKIVGRKEEDCKEMFLTLTGEIRKHRTMEEIISDVLSSLPKLLTTIKSWKKVKKPISAFFMYVHDSRPAMAQKYPKYSRDEIRRKLKKKWDASEELQAKYKELNKIALDEYKSLMLRRKESTVKKTYKPVAPTAFRMFAAKHEAATLQQNPEMDKHQVSSKLKLEFNALPGKKKFKYMLKALEAMPEFQKKFEAYKQTHPDVKDVSPNLYLSKDELTVLSKKIQKPQPVPKNVFLLFCTKERHKLKKLSMPEQAKELSSLYAKLDDQIKATYESEFVMIVDNHVKDLSEYLSKISPWSNTKAKSAETEIEKYKKILVNRSRQTKKKLASEEAPVDEGSKTSKKKSAKQKAEEDAADIATEKPKKEIKKEKEAEEVTLKKSPKKSKKKRKSEIITEAEDAEMSPKKKLKSEQLIREENETPRKRIIKETNLSENKSSKKKKKKEEKRHENKFKPIFSMSFNQSLNESSSESISESPEPAFKISPLRTPKSERDENSDSLVSAKRQPLKTPKSAETVESDSDSS